MAKKIEYKSVRFKRPKKIMGVRTIFPFSLVGKITVDNTLFIGKKVSISEIIVLYETR